MTNNTLIIGAKQTGKSTIMVNRALKSMENEEPLIFIDTDGSAIDEIAHRTKPKFLDHTTVLDFSQDDPTPLVPPTDKDMVLALLRDLADYDGSTNLFDNLVSMLAASALPRTDATFLHMLLMLYSEKFRGIVLKDIPLPWVKAYWTHVFETWDDRQKTQNTQSTLTQLNLFATNDVLRRYFCYPQAPFGLKDKRTVLIKLPRYKLGTKTVRQIGLVLFSILPGSHHIFIDDAAQFDGDLLKLILSDYQVTLSLSERGKQDWVLNHSGEKIILQLDGIDADYFNRLLGRTGMVDGQIQKLDPFYSARLLPGVKLQYEAHRLPTQKTYSQSPATLRKERPTVPVALVDRATDQIAEQYLAD